MGIEDFEDRVAKHQATPVYLVEVTAGDVLRTWTPVIYESPYSVFESVYEFGPQQIRVDGVAAFQYSPILEDTKETRRLAAIAALDITEPEEPGPRNAVWMQEDGGLFLVMRPTAFTNTPFNTTIRAVKETTSQILKDLWEPVLVGSEELLAHVWHNAFDLDELRADGTAITPVADANEAYLLSQAWGDSIGAWWTENTGADLYVVLREELQARTPWNTTIQAMIPFFFSTHPKVFDGTYYDPRVLSLPNLSIRVESQFGGVSQIGGGSLSFNNQDGFFSNLQHLQWDAGRTRLKAGVDLPGDELASSLDYQDFGAWLNGAYDCNGESFNLQLSEQKLRLQKKIPLSFYTLEEFPEIDPQAVGKPIPIAYGSVKAATPVRISRAEYKLAGHSITSIDRIQYQVDGNWTDIDQSLLQDDPYNLTTATFRIHDDLLDDPIFSVDFKGIASSTQILKENAAEIIADIIQLVGETDINGDSIAEARRRLDTGTYKDTDQSASRMPVSLYIDEEVTALEVIDQINRAVGSYLYVGLDGMYHYEVFLPIAAEERPEPSSDLGAPKLPRPLPDLDETVIQSFDMTTDTAVISRVIATYNQRPAEDTLSTYSESRNAVRYRHGIAEHNTHGDELPFVRPEDARYWVQRTLAMRGVPTRLYSVSLHWLGLLYKPTSQVVVRYKRDGFDIDGVFEVLEQNIDLKSNSVSLLLGERHGFERCGHWAKPEVRVPFPMKVEDGVFQSPSAESFGVGYGALFDEDWSSNVKVWARENNAYGPWLPERFAGQAGYADEAAGDGYAGKWKIEWSPEIKAWARQNLAFWCDENGFAHTQDKDSYMLTRWF